MTTRYVPQDVERFEIRYESLFRPGSGMSFPCDDLGSVDIDALPPRARSNYLFARAMVGREYDHPAIVEA